MKIKYFISGRLPATWEDFIPEEGFEIFPKITISTGHKEESISGPDEHGWIDVEISDKMITKKIATDIITIVCEQYGNKIVINERGFCQSV